jgi:hypothetical protein
VYRYSIAVYIYILYFVSSLFWPLASSCVLHCCALGSGGRAPRLGGAPPGRRGSRARVCGLRAGSSGSNRPSAVPGARSSIRAGGRSPVAGGRSLVSNQPCSMLLHPRSVSSRGSWPPPCRRAPPLARLGARGGPRPRALPVPVLARTLALAFVPGLAPGPWPLAWTPTQNRKTRGPPPRPSSILPAPAMRPLRLNYALLTKQPRSHPARAGRTVYGARRPYQAGCTTDTLNFVHSRSHSHELSRCMLRSCGWRLRRCAGAGARRAGGVTQGSKSK